jgi:hypothetical protein
MTRFGKILVMLTVVFSFLFLGLSAAVYLNSPNWGWDPKHARKEFGQPIPSELDKRKPIITQLGQVKSRAVVAWNDGSKKLADIERAIPIYQYRYAEELARIRASADAINPKALVELPPKDMWKDPRTGKLVFEFGETSNSYLKYLGQLKTLLGEIQAKRTEVEAAIKEEQKVTEELNGKMEGGKLEKGLYALMGLEEEVRRRAEEELEDLKPIYYEEQLHSQSLLRRQAALNARIEELKTTSKTKPAE